MEIVAGIPNPLKGERVVAVAPTPSMTVEAGWRSRLHLYGGRALGAQALALEQQSRAGRLATRGQALSPGIVQGLELAVERAGPGDARLVIGAGMGLCAGGEDVVLPLPLRLEVGALPVFASHPEDSAFDRTLDALRAAGELGADPAPFILRLRPALLPLSGRFDPEDPCGDDEAGDAFEDLQIADAALAELVPWPDDLLLPPPPASFEPAALHALRNLLVWAIFDAEAALPAGELMPWAAEGVALGLVLVAPGPDGAGNRCLFADRFGVARAGGRPRRRTSVFDAGGHPFLWQARMEQLAEQLADPTFAALEPAARAAALRRIPPSGLLLRDAVRFDGAAAPLHSAFDPAWPVDAVPIPLEQLDVVLEASASLAPLRAPDDPGAGIPEAVRVYVPVPGDLWDPHLLLTEVIDARFAETLEALRGRRNLLLARRRWLRDRINLLYAALEGRPFVFADDPPGGDAEPAEDALPAIPEDDPELAYGTLVTDGGLQVEAIEALFAELTTSIGAPLVSSDLPDGLNLRQTGLRLYIERLKLEVDHADDHIDIGFARLHTDIYRIRQMVLGKDVADKLVTNSALAAIVEKETSSYVTSKSLGDYVSALKTKAGLNLEAPEGVEAESPLLLARGFNFQPAGLTASATTFKPTASLAALTASGSPTFAAPASGFAGAISAGAISAGGVAAAEPSFRAGIDTSAFVTPVGGGIDMTSVVAAAGGFQVIPSIESTPDDVAGQLPITGAVPLLHDITIGQRLEVAASEIANQNSKATHAEIVTALGGSSLFADMDVPFVSAYTQEGKATVSTAKVGAVDTAALLALQPPSRDDIGRFNASVDSIDVSVAALRAGEARLLRYRTALQRARETLATVQSAYSAVSGRHGTIARDLAEARHDVAVAISLTAEEQARIIALNERRRRILRDEVPFLAYARPRTLAAIALATPHPLLPAAAAAAVPACLRAPAAAVPAELRALVGLLRSAPLRWQPRLLPLIDRLDRIESLDEVLLTGVARTQVAALSKLPAAPARFASRFEEGIWRTIQSQSVVTFESAQVLARSGWSGASGYSWKQVRELVVNHAAIDDLTLARHGHSEVGPEALRALDDIARVAACLHLRFAGVPALLRLRWSELLSQYDAPLNLRDLSALPGWAELEADDRVTLQEMVNWLHGSVDPSIAQAVALINDVIRVCILLASHAPVDRLIEAKVVQPAPLVVGGTVTIRAEAEPIQIGAPVFFYDPVQPTTVIGRGVVEDLLGKQSLLRIQSVTLPGHQVDFSTPISVSMSSLSGLSARFG